MKPTINTISAAIGSSYMLVIDLETGSVAKDNSAVILTIGATLVRVPDLVKVSKLYLNVNPYCEHNVARSWDDSTMEFWANQSQEATSEAMKKEGTLSLSDALSRLVEYAEAVKQGGCRVYPFGNGSEFDLSILVHAYHQVGLAVPWNYGDQQSIRTIVWIGRIFFGVDFKADHEFVGTRHISIDDSENEAEYTIKTLEHITSFIPANEQHND